MNGKQKIQIAVIDGLGGGLGSQIVSRLRGAIGSKIEIIALGTNAIATSRMMQSGSDKAATGENAIGINVHSADFILGPLGIMMPNAMLGEITPQIAESVGLARGKKILLPVNQPHFDLIGLPNRPLTEMVDQLILVIEEEVNRYDQKE